MEKKSIGRFISTLRKAGGMTQKELAEKLNVSDKAVSRWERDESAPDLTLIPVIAEIFGVTSDEILRGERINFSSGEQPGFSQKSERQLAHIIRSGQTKFQLRSIISVSIALLGLIAAMACNLGFNRGYLGFFIGCAFFVAAMVCETGFFITALSSVKCDDFSGKEICIYKNKAVNLFILAASAILCIFSAALPLIVILWDPYIGLSGSDWLGYGLIFIAICAAICFLASLFIKNKLNKKGILTFSDSEKALHSLKTRCTAVTAAFLLVTAILQLIFSSSVGANTLVSGKEFTDYESFIEFMETPVIYEDMSYSGAFILREPDSDIAAEPVSDDSTYYDQYGNEITYEEFIKQDVFNDKGEYLFSYDDLNESVRLIEYSSSENCLPITVFTEADLVHGGAIKAAIHTAFFIAYGLEIIGGIIEYNIKKKKLK